MSKKESRLRAAFSLLSKLSWRAIFFCAAIKNKEDFLAEISQTIAPPMIAPNSPCLVC
jgi:hypothetical protein